MNNMKNVLNGVMCRVEECGYNYDRTKCTAPSIDVGGKRASNPDDTQCDTFTNKNKK